MFRKAIERNGVALEKFNTEKIFGTAQSQGFGIESVVQALVLTAKIGDPRACLNARSYQYDNVLFPLQQTSDTLEETIGILNALRFVQQMVGRNSNCGR